MMLPLFDSSGNHRLDQVLGLRQRGPAHFAGLRTAAARPIFAHRLSTAIRNLIAFFSYRAS
jgi:hypothetical protein